jgi:arginyl-tRNA synthetase
MADPILHLTSLLQQAYDNFEPGADPVTRPSDRADYQSNGILPLAKRLGRNPRDVAAELIETAAEDLRHVATVEVAGPGFLNITLNAGYVERLVNGLNHDIDRVGVREAAVAERVVVDYSAPNVAKEMHVGHLRSTIIGDALVRLLTFAGHTVVRENHVGDWGLSFGMLIEHLTDLQNTAGAEHFSIGDLGDFYKQARAKFEATDDFKERSRNRVVALQTDEHPDHAETLRLWQILVDQSAAYFQEVYDKLGILLRTDDIVGESFYNPMLDAVVNDLTAHDLLKESDGALCAFPPGFLGREGDPQPLIVKNRNGGFGYAATDLATVRDRVGRLDATWLLYVVGSPQALHLTMVWKVAELAGWITPPVRAVHVSFGSVLGPDRKMYRTRAGESIRLVDLLDEAVNRARAELDKRTSDLSGDEREAVARAVGIGAVKYADLSNDRIKDYVFDWDRMLAFEGNTAPYLQYACARIASIIRKAGEQAEDLVGEKIDIREPQERALAMSLLGFDAAVHDAIDKLGPHRLCTYLFDLAQTFTSFYDACPVLRADVAEDVRRSRLALCQLTMRVLGRGLHLLGIEVPDRM